MGELTDRILDRIFGTPGSQNAAVSTVDKVTASKKSEIDAIQNSKQSAVLVSSITQQRKFKPTVTSVPGQEGVNAPNQIQQFAVAANLSGGFKGGLTQTQVNDVRAKPFTEQELEDIKRLDARRDKSKGTTKFGLKDSGTEVVQKKREQAAIARGNIVSRFGGQSFFKGKLFANPKFGAPSNDPGNLSKAELEEIRVNKIKNAKLRKERTIVGTGIQTDLTARGITQKEAARSKGANLIGGNKLNAIALAKLREKGLI